MSQLLDMSNESSGSRVNDLEKRIDKLVEEMEALFQDVQLKMDLDTVQLISDVQSFQVGNAIVTEKTGWIIKTEVVDQPGGDQFFIEKQLPFSIISINMPVIDDGNDANLDK